MILVGGRQWLVGGGLKQRHSERSEESSDILNKKTPMAGAI